MKKTEITALSSVCTHSSKVKDGSLFVALKGKKSDGHNHLKQAVERGACVLLVEQTDSVPVTFKGTILRYKEDPNLPQILNEFYDFPSEKLFTVGVTGTNGKTSFCYLLERLFQHCGWPTGVIGTVDQHFKEHKWPAVLTSPEPVELFERLNDFVHLGAKAVSIEVSSHALDQKRVSGIDFNALVFTNLSQDHLDYHRDMESYFQAKRRLFFLSKGKNTFCLVNQDEEYGRRLKKETPCWTYGQDKSADFRFQIKNFARNGAVFELKSPSGVHEFYLPQAGEHGVYNATGALACAMLTGFKAEDCAQALKTFSGVPGRQKRIAAGKKLPFEVMLDYAHTPVALACVLSALKTGGQRVILVVGCGGDRDKEKRPQMAEAALRFADQIFWTTDNPRFEEPEQIAQGALGHLTGKQKEKITVELDRKTAIQKAICSAGRGDIVLIAGKGHEAFQIVKDQKIPFSDKSVALDCLKSLS